MGEIQGPVRDTEIASDADYQKWMADGEEPQRIEKNDAQSTEDDQLLPTNDAQSTEDDHLLPNIPAHLYYKLLSEGVAKRQFFNNPITVHEGLFRFKTTVNVEEEDSDTEEVTTREEKIYLEFSDLTQDNFQFVRESLFVHLVSPAGTGKTMTMLQLAKSYERESDSLVTVVCKAEYFWREHSQSSSMVDVLVNSSMVTVDIRTAVDQHEWRTNLSRVIQNGTGVILLLDAVDEMKSVERDEFLQHIRHMIQDIPGQVNGVNIAALVLSSRPGVTLPTPDDVRWTTLKMTKVKDSNRVLKTLCTDTEIFHRAKSMQQSFKFPQTLFWYSLLAIEARSVDPARAVAASQFDFLGGLLLRSIQVTQSKRESFDIEQQYLLNEDPTLILHMAALIAYLAKTLGTTRITQLEPYFSSLILQSGFPPAFMNAAGTLIKKLLPLFQFCHCCYSCTESSTYKFIQFDHQIIWDYLAAEFIVKTIVQRSYPSLLTNLNDDQNLRFDWKACIRSTASQNSEWAQTLHLVADALPPTQLAPLIKECDELEAITWISNVRDHPKCRDVTNLSMDFVKVFLSSLFNASRKGDQRTTHQRKKLKDEGPQWVEDNDLTALGFDLVVKLFRQPIIGQSFINDICQFKSLSLLLDELRLRSRHEEFLEIFGQKFETSEISTLEELGSLVNQLVDSEYQPFIMDRLFYRLSSKCAEEAVDHPVREAIHNIFVDTFKEQRCADYLIERLSSADGPVQASASAVLSCFKALSNERVRHILSMITPTNQSHRIINALPEVLPLEVFEELKCLALSWDTYFSHIYHAFNRFENEQQSYDKLITLFDYPQTYLVAKLKLSDKRDMILSDEQISRLAMIYSDPAAFYRRELDASTVQGVKSCVVQVLRFQKLTPEQQARFDLLPKPQAPRQPPKRQFQIGNRLYNALPLEYYLQHFCGNPITEEQITLLSHYYLPHYVKSAEPAFQLLAHVADQFKLSADTITPEMIRNSDARYIGLRNRQDSHVVAAKHIVHRFLSLMRIDKYVITDDHVAQLVAFMNVSIKLHIAYKDEWFSLLDFSDCETLFVQLLLVGNAHKWSVNTLVRLWQLLGTPHYQAYRDQAENKIFPQIVPGLVKGWTRDDIARFQTSIAELDFCSKLQLEVENVIAKHTSEQ